jgi:hypothetical protein
MPTYNAVAFFFEVVISLGIVLLLYALLGKSLGELLDKTIRLPAGSTSGHRGSPESITRASSLPSGILPWQNLTTPRVLMNTCASG